MYQVKTTAPKQYDCNRKISKFLTVLDTAFVQILAILNPERAWKSKVWHMGSATDIR